MPTYQAPGVYVTEVEPGSRPIQGVGTAVAAFVGLAPTGRTDEPVLIANWTQFVNEFGGLTPGMYLGQAVYGYLQNGGGACYVVRVAGDGAAPGVRALLPSAEDDKTPALEVTAVDPSLPDKELSVEVVGPAEGAAPDTFSLVVKRAGEEVARHADLTLSRGARNAATVVNRESDLIHIQTPAPDAPATIPKPGAVALTGAKGKVSAPGAPQYVGDASARTGLSGLEAIDEVTMVAVPDIVAPGDDGKGDLTAIKAVQIQMIAHCESMADRVAILDPPPGLRPQEVLDWRMNAAGYDSKYAVLYYPWISVADPTSDRGVLVPPSGHVAGVWGRSDDSRGVHKAPANETIRGVLDLTMNVTSTEQESLNPVGVNVIRKFPGRGIRVWGARTLSSDDAWRYLNVRRLFNYVEESIAEGTQWIVFEPNDQALWQRIRRTVGAFLLRTWRDGALAGAKPEDAFYVKCDEETNPPDVVDAGQVVIEVGIAPVKPAEFVVFRLAQFSGGALVSE